MPQPTLTSEDYLWDKFDAATYELSENKRRCFFKGDPSKQYRPVIGDKGFSEGKHYWRVACPCDNIRVGLAREGCPLDSELGSTDKSWAIDLQTGDVWHNVPGEGELKTRSIYVPAPGAVARLYKVVVPISGGMIGFKLDLDEGTLAFYFNDEYMGIAIKDPDLKSKGPFFPCAAIGGLEGKVVTSPEEKKDSPQLYAYKRNKL
eukprot:NODE_6669_length_827_cov_150.330966_g6433_i0.p1 GENE.NODE_6669_length_827_cov_150.330966_g6433_i0~~NODE_6669_length_827_cov_150.330966_g6433_i0.p1  ORF type:complete len:228 (+),score=69.41 NODE_6669_length_827_cov_150.330966_g6433_i0:73-684(+)